MVFTIGNFSAIISSDIFFLLLSLQAFSDTNYKYVRSFDIIPPVIEGGSFFFNLLLTLLFNLILSVDISLKYIYPFFCQFQAAVKPISEFFISIIVFYSFRISFGSSLGFISLP